MYDTFTFNGVSSDTMGVYITDCPVIPIPQQRVNFVTVPGRSGSLTVLEGENVYDDITITLDCVVDFAYWEYDGLSDAALPRIREIAEWLRGEGELVVPPRRLGGTYKARVVNQIDFKQVLRRQKPVTFSVSFRCNPFMYVGTYEYTIVSSTTRFSGGGSVDVAPLITVGRANTECSITINGDTITIPADPTLSTIYIDCENMVAYNDDGDNLTSIVSGDWPVLHPRSNTVTTTMFTYRSCKLSGRWRGL